MMTTEQRVQGRPIGPEELGWLRELIAAHPEWSRKALAREVCRVWEWRDGRGRAKDFAARSLLLKLASRGEIVLPALRARRPGQWAWAKRAVGPLAEPVPWAGALSDLQPLAIERVEAGSAAHRIWREYLARHHYLGLKVVGENLGYLVRARDGREVACLLFGAAAWRCAPRDQYLGWTAAERAERLGAVANNTRFLILPWIEVKNLASFVLGRVARRISADWQAKYGHGLGWLETFVERERFRGTCYQAANWQRVGQTTGRSRQDRGHRLRVPVKDIYLYALAR